MAPAMRRCPCVAAVAVALAPALVVSFVLEEVVSNCAAGAGGHCAPPGPSFVETQARGAAGKPKHSEDEMIEEKKTPPTIKHQKGKSWKAGYPEQVLTNTWKSSHWSAPGPNEKGVPPTPDDFYLTLSQVRPIGVETGGSCLFHAMVYWLKVLGFELPGTSNEGPASTLRKITAAFEYELRGQEVWFHKLTNSYLYKLANDPKHYGTELEAAALSKLFKVRVVTYGPSSHMGKLKRVQDTSFGQPPPLPVHTIWLFNGNYEDDEDGGHFDDQIGGHFDALIPQALDAPLQVDQKTKVEVETRVKSLLKEWETKWQGQLDVDGLNDMTRDNDFDVDRIPFAPEPFPEEIRQAVDSLKAEYPDADDVALEAMARDFLSGF